MKFKILIIAAVIAAGILSAGNARAQAVIKVDSYRMLFYIMDNLIFKEKIDADAELWKRLNVKTVMTEYSAENTNLKTVSKLNKNGYIYIRKSYDADGFVTKELYVKYKEGTNEPQYFEYTDKNYSFADTVIFKGGRMDKIISKDKTREYDSVYFYYNNESNLLEKLVFAGFSGNRWTYYLNYDSMGRMISAAEETGEIFYRAEYSEDKIFIHSKDADMVYEYTNNIFSKLTSKYSDEPGEFIEDYTIGENGMRNGGSMINPDGSIRKIKITYTYNE